MEQLRRLSSRDRRLAGGAVVLAAIVVVGVGVLLTAAPPASPSASGSPSAAGSASATSAPTASLAVGPSGSPGSGDAWTAVGDTSFQPVSSLTAASFDASGVAPTSTFLLQTKAPLDAVGLARSIDVTPAAPFDVLPGPSATAATIKPAQPLAAGQVYRFALHDTSGAELGSWAFRVASPLHVATTLPGDQSTFVPLDTGIEITFDQDGATDVASHVSIDPPVKGHTEMHGRTFVFVPDALMEQTLYTVTVHHGIAISGSDQVLAHDVRFAFETEATQGTDPQARIEAEQSVLEASPRERLTVALSLDVPDGATAPTKVPVGIFRLASESSALAALRVLGNGPSWADYSQAGQVDVAHLHRVVRFDATLGSFGDDSDGRWFRLPVALPVGWYVIDITRPARDLQMFLQVTDVATYVAVTSDRTVVWVNDTATRRALVGARVTLSGGAALGRTDTRGLLVAATPSRVRDGLALTATAAAGDDYPILVVRDRSGRDAFAPVTGTSSGAHVLGGPGDSAVSDADRFVRLLYTDRQLYRQTDSVDVWGLVRDRDRATLPGKVEVRIVSDAADPTSPPIVTRTVTLRPTGAFAIPVPLDGVPIGSYAVQLWVGPLELSTTGITVDVIRKPAYQITVTTDRHALIAGDSVTVTSRLAFFDDTPVPSTTVLAQGFDDGSGDLTATGTTGADGVAAVSLKTRLDPVIEGYDQPAITVHPVGPEESSISAYTGLVVFPSSLWLAGDATVKGGRLVLTGSVHDVDLAAIERRASEIAAANGFVGLDPAGAPRKGQVVQARIVELVPVKTLTGRGYDFVTKKVVDTYSYDIVEKPVTTRRLVSGAAGRIALDLAVAHPSHAYRIVLTTTDSHGRTARLTVDAERPLQVAAPSTRPFLTGASVCSGPGPALQVGQTITTTMSDGRGALPSGGSNTYLFIDAQRGLRSVKLQSSATYRKPFSSTDVPDLSVLGVRFTGDSYAPAEVPLDVRFDPAARAITIHLTSDALEYRPGGTVTLSVETRDAAGRPVAATVTLRVVDQKIFAIGGASEVDPLTDLYAPVSSGILGAHATRQDLYPIGDDGCGATGGGGDESLTDALLFRTVDTDTTGHATVSFQLADALTAWHVSAAAVTRSLQAGEGAIVLPVGLPFFVQASLAPEYLVDDRPSVRLRAFGSALKAGDPVTFSVASSTLGMPATVVHGSAFQPIDVPLTALKAGTRRSPSRRPREAARPPGRTP